MIARVPMIHGKPRVLDYSEDPARQILYPKLSQQQMLHLMLSQTKRFAQRIPATGLALLAVQLLTEAKLAEQ